MRAGMDRLKSQLDSTLLEFDIAKRELLAIQEDVVVKVCISVTWIQSVKAYTFLVA